MTITTNCSDAMLLVREAEVEALRRRVRELERFINTLVGDPQRIVSVISKRSMVE